MEYKVPVDKWTRKYMKMAKALADDNTSCYSRKIGVVLISQDNTPIGFGYNGSVAGAPHNDDPRYLAHLWKNLLTDEQKEYLRNKYDLQPAPERSFVHKMCFVRDECDPVGEAFVNKFDNCKTCPRRLLDLPSGKDLELCGCAHAERNAIANAAKQGTSTKGATMYCWCSTPCHECSTVIINAGIQKLVCLETELPDYSKSSRGLFKMANREVVYVKAEDILKE